jgi:hypothetical protein
MTDAPKDEARSEATGEAKRRPGYPLNKVVAVADQPSAVEAVVNGLTDMGVDEDSIGVVCEADARRHLEEFRARHPVKSRLIRLAQSLSDERAIVDRYGQWLESGKFLVVAPAADSARAEEVGEAMKENGAHFVNYYGPLTITTIAP